MVTPIYNRSEIYSFYDLTEEQQTEVLNMYSYEGIEEDSFVIHNGKKYSHTLPLSMFEKCNWMNTGKSIWDGIYGTSAFSAYFIKINNSGDECVVAERFQ